MSIETTLLDTLLAGVGRERFCREYWERRSLALPGQPERFAALGVDLARFRAQLFHSQLIKIGYLDRAGGHREMPISAHLADLVEAGPTLCAGGIEAQHPTLWRLIHDVRRGLGHVGHVSVNAYLSTHDQGFGMHLDGQAVFILQIEGVKRWTFGAAPAVCWPEQGTAPAELDAWNEHFPECPLSPPRPDELREVVLRPGDALFMPAGTWHQAHAEGSSFALTLSIVPLSAEQLILELLDRLEEGDPAWRAPCPVSWAMTAPQDRLPEEVERWATEGLARLRAALRALRPEDLARDWDARLALSLRAPT